MSDKAAARQYAVRNKKNFSMCNPEYIPEPTGASKHRTSTQHNCHKHKHKQPPIGQSDDKAATSIGKSEEAAATSIGKSDDTVKTPIGKSNDTAGTSRGKPTATSIGTSLVQETSEYATSIGTSLVQETSEYREREHHNPEPTGASNTSTELEAIAQFLAIIHAEDALSERELAALVSRVLLWVTSRKLTNLLNRRESGKGGKGVLR